MNTVTARSVQRLHKSKDTLYNQISSIPVYKNHRHTLRPWDRQLPPTIDQEANRRQQWELHPPKEWQIFLALLLCVVGALIAGCLSLTVNNERISIMWRDTNKPSLVYTNGKVLLAVWVVAHICSGFSLWFVWLAEGFEKHLRVMAGICLMLFLDCIWLDVLFYTYRLDVTIGLWVVVMGTIIVTQVLLVKDGIAIGALFLIPLLATSIAVLVYLAAFAAMFGTTWATQTIASDQLAALRGLSVPEFLSTH